MDAVSARLMMSAFIYCGITFPFPHFSLLLSAHCFDRDKGNAVSAVAKSAEAQSCSLSMSQYINAAMHAAVNKLDPQLETGKVSSHGQVRNFPNGIDEEIMKK